jgi:excisionase family DNA binding protein
MPHDSQRAAPGAFKPAEAAAWLSISRTQLYRLIRSGEIRTRRCGTRILISRRALEEYLETDASA